MNDQTPMPFGKHKGKKLADVPADYLLFLDRQNYLKGALKGYVEENRRVLGQKANRIRLNRPNYRQGM